LLGLREESLDSKPKIAIVIKKKAVAYTNNFNVNIKYNYKIKINKETFKNVEKSIPSNE
jgi:hypothetical protein